MSINLISLEQLRLSKTALWLSCLALVYSLSSANPGLTLFGLALIPIFFKLLFLPGEPPVLLFALAYQWLQVFIPIFSANLVGLNLKNDGEPPNLDIATLLSLLTLFFLALGMYVARQRKLRKRVAQIKIDAYGFSVKRLLIAYILANLLDVGIKALELQAPGLYQPLLPLSLFRWTIVFIILWAAQFNKRLQYFAAGVFLFEILSGLFGFFSSFKNIIFIAIIVTAMNSQDTRRFFQFKTVLLVALTVFLATFWQAVKIDYRFFLNKGTRTQTVLVSPMEQVEFLFDKVSDLTLNDLSQGLASGAERIGYVNFFARVTKIVPAHIPYQNGSLWGEAITHIFTPRLFFPKKPAIDDSERVNAFSGIVVAGAEQGTSVSLGYATESYIDFGPIFMFIPVFALGFFWSWSYSMLANSGKYPLLALSFATSYILSGAILFESSNIKLLGGAVTSLLVGWFILNYFSSRIWGLIHPSLRKIRPSEKIYLK